MKKTFFDDKKVSLKHILNIVIVIAILVVFWIYTNMTIEKNRIFTPMISQGQQQDYYTSVMKDTSEVTQEIAMIENTNGVTIGFVTFGTKVHSGTIQLQLIDEDGGVLENIFKDARYIVDNQYTDFKFKNTYDSGRYTVKLTFTGIGKESIALILSNPNERPDINMKINGVLKEEDLAMNYILDEHDLYFYMVNIIMFIISLLIIGVYVLVYIYKTDIEKIYIPVGLIMGIIMMVLIPPNVVPDESVHFYTAYEVSNKMLGIENSDNGTLVMRSDDAYTPLPCTGMGRVYYTQYLARFEDVFVNNSELVETACTPLKTNNHFYYIFSGLGLTIGRILHLNTVHIYTIARVMNLLLFCYAVYFALRMIPFGKMILFVLAMLPMTQQQVISVSYDSNILSLSMLIIALSLKLAFDERIKKRYVLLLTLSVVLLLPAKQFALTPICCLPVIIWMKKHRENKKMTRWFLVFAGLMVLLIIIFRIRNQQVLSAIVIPDYIENTYITWADSEGYTLGYLLSHFSELFYIIVNTIVNKGDFYFLSLLGTSLGWFEIGIPLIFVLPFTFLLFLASCTKVNETKQLDGKNKAFLWMVFLMGFGFAAAGMLLGWTPMGYTYVEGVQGRYLLPFLPCALLALRNGSVTVEKNIDTHIAFFTVLMQFFTLIGIVL